MIVVSLLAVAGLVVCAYSIYLEYKISTSSSYKPLCDISDKMSCTKPMRSIYAKTFGVSNALWGLTYYTLMLLLSLCSCSLVMLFVALFGCLMSAYFAYLLLVKIKTVCVLCVSTYVINIALLLTIYFSR